ncbi:MAG: hypothetical protein CMH55_10870 [Myxococcales bacterium]|nr:hypothetical protein [Myxococcales bacterium]
MRSAEELLGPDGPLPDLLPGHETRPDQLHMARAVEEQLTHGGLLVVEAGTGVGKSLAYLLPAALWAKANERRVVISTNTIPLQDQLLKKDLPVVRKLLKAAGLNEPLRYRQLVGRGNYLCEHRLNHAQAEVVRGDQLFDDEGRVLADVERWNGGDDHEGRRQEIPFGVPASTWDRINADADNCLNRRCNYYDRCHFFNSRKRAGSADLLVVNHALLLADRVVRGGGDEAEGVLPDWDVAVLDEGHHLQDIATRAFTVEVSRRSLNRHLDRLANPRFKDRGELATLEIALGQVTGAKESIAERLADLLHEDLHVWVDSVRDAAESLWDQLIEAYSQDESRQVWIDRHAAESETWQSCSRQLRGLKTSLQQLVYHLDRVLGQIEAESLHENDDAVRHGTLGIQSRRRRLHEASESLDALENGEDWGCTWVEVGSMPKDRRWARNVGLNRAPVEVREMLEEYLYQGPHALVMTSATLTTGPQDFRLLVHQTGLDLHQPEPRLLAFGSPFNHGEQALLATLPNHPDPRQNGGQDFESACDVAIETLVRASEGGALVLFTSRRQMRGSFDRLAPALLGSGYQVFVQGQRGLARSELLNRFRRQSKGVLFGTDSFWEGVDVPGEALRLVILTRLPFKPPTEPITRARHARIEAEGGRPFSVVTLPEAILKLRQGYGRLLRHREDYGAVVILDPRIESLGYGRRFLKALPPARRLRGHLDTVVQAVSQATGVPH